MNPAQRPTKPNGYQLDELENVVNHYPVFPGNTVTHRSMIELSILGFAVRNQCGDWIPTAAGIKEWERVRGDR